jgi:hypothetical protein
LTEPAEKQTVLFHIKTTKMRGEKIIRIYGASRTILALQMTVFGL